MRIIADSGSTKTLFIITDGDERKEVFTSGINPYYQSEEEIVETLANQLVPNLNGDADMVSFIEFYGAGCNEVKAPIVERAIKTVFVSADVIVGSDLLGAAKGLCGNSAGITCILGTGSNSCFYNGNEIVKNVSPLGFILGDEGSGAVLGKLLVADIFKNQAPAEICNKFATHYGFTAADVIDKVYRQPFPNRYLAGFAPFIYENIDNEYCHNLVYNAFISFIQRNLKQYDCSTPVHFTGSIAYYFKDILAEALKAEGMTLGIIKKTPLS